MRIRQLLIVSFLFIAGYCPAQTLQQKLQSAFDKLQADSQCRYASVSLTVMDVNTGQEVFAANPNMGLAPASTLKTITTITAFNVLGGDFRYQTHFGYMGQIGANGTLDHDIVIRGAGDPTLGSWRYDNTKEHDLLTSMVDAIRKAGIKKINGKIIGDESLFDSQSIPDGWIWQDVGNYYGAGTSGLCWRENQYEIKFHTGGDHISVSREVPTMPYLNFISGGLLNAPAHTGDLAYAYLPVNGNTVYLRGTYAADLTKKAISATVPDPAFDLSFRLTDTLQKLGITVTGGPESAATLAAKGLPSSILSVELLTIQSPQLSKIIYWTNQKSINLYAEQLLKTIAWKLGIQVSTANGVKALQDFWHAKGIDPNSLNIFDGSGLSPGDRVTTRAMATILQSATKAPWYHDFYESLPIYNDMHMKSGSINNVLNYAGYQTHHGQQLCFAIMVNNYNGASKEIKEKVFRVLDELK